jgi:two-component system nitrate/nitrite response regulator NarL
VRVFVICDIRLYADGLVQILGSDGRMSVVGRGDDWGGAMVRIQALSDAPEAVLVDASLKDGPSGVHELSAAFPETAIVAVATSEDEDQIVPWAEAGVSALVSRQASVDDLIRTVETAARGETLCSPRVAAALLRRVAALANDRPPVLTTREQEIVRLIDLGLSNKEIASRLHIELATVKNHVHHILTKLNASRRGQAAAMVRNNLAASERSEG